MALTKVQAGLIESTITSGTAVASTSGTSIDFTGIPSGVKRITVMFSGVSTNGSAAIRFQLGTASGVESTGYFSTGGWLGSGSTAIASTSGFDSYGDGAAASLRYGQFVFNLLSSSTNTWAMSGSFSTSGVYIFAVTGSKSLGNVLDRIRITTTNGTDTFDAGSINILYES